MAVNFGGPRGSFPGPLGPGTPPSGRFRNMYQQSPPPAGQGRGIQKDRPVTFLPNDLKIPRQPKQPDKPLPAYMRYSRKVWETVKAQHPEMKMWDIGKLIGEQWRNLPEDERQGFLAEYEVEKAEYQEAMKSYHNSSAYRDWLKAKEKAQQAMQEHQMMEKMMGAQLPKEEPRFQLQQMEEDDDDDFSSKHIAAARFQRNHKLISDIFNDSAVPDIKSIVTKPRLENLKKQVQSLMQHQKKLETEIKEMESKFEAKKAKILKKSDDFEEKIKKLSEPPPSPPEIPANIEENKVSSPVDKDTADEEKPSETISTDESNEQNNVNDVSMQETVSGNTNNEQKIKDSDVLESDDIASPVIAQPSTTESVTTSMPTELTSPTGSNNRTDSNVNEDENKS